MKKYLVTAAIVLLLGSVGAGIAVQANSGKELTIVDNDQPVNKVTAEESIQLENIELTNNAREHSDVNEFAEYDVIASKVDVEKHQPNVVKDNKHKRVILWKDSNQREQYKSIYMKKKNRLKVVDFNGGLVINEVIRKGEVVDNTQKEATASTVAETKVPQIEDENIKQSAGIESYSEYGTIANHVHMNDLHGQVVEDNQYKRVIILKDDNDHKQYKSIYMKKVNKLKVISFNNGLLYNGSI